MKTLIFSLTAMILLSLSYDTGYAATYKYKDKSGNTVYSQRPPPTGHYERIKTPKRRPIVNDTSAAEKFVADAEENRRVKESIAKEVAKNEEIRKKNCEGAKKNLQIYQVYRRIQGKDGEVIVLTDKQREEKIQKSKDGIAQFCH